jgi:primosomal protein N' (replication factor Y)
LPACARDITGKLVASVFPLIGSWRLDRSFDYAVPDDLTGDVVVGSLVRMTFGNRRVRGLVVDLSERTSRTDELVSISGVVGPGPVAPTPLPDVMGWMATRYCVPFPSVVERIVPPRVRVTGARAVLREPGTPRLLPRYRGAREMADAIASGGAGAFVVRRLAGDDRAGLVGEILGFATSGSSLVAVPEVRYGSAVLETTQDLGAVRLDSAVTDIERSRAWFGLAAGTARCGAGGRSAVLAPASDLRVIVLDDEHDPAFKEDRAPRYDARRVALHRARTSNAVCVFISSSPSVESGFSATGGVMRPVEPTRELEREARPIVEIVERPGDRALSSSLHARIQLTLREGRSVALLTPAAGYARALWCATCRRSVRCERCESGMALFRSSRAIHCPHCGYETPAPSVCPSCGVADLRSLGAGSERLAEQAVSAFPRGTVVRMDPDVLARRGPPGNPGGDKPLVYVTTWIGTKLSIRPSVGLVGVLDADALIRRPVWSAAESAYHALAEMAAWAGPASSGGRLVIQTAESGHHAVQAVVRADYNYFLERELHSRRELGYPPYAQLMRVAALGDDAQTWIERAATAAAAAGGDVLGPVETDVRSARDTPAERGLELLVKAGDIEEVAQSLRVILPNVPRGTRLRVDTDPR